MEQSPPKTIESRRDRIKRARADRILQAAADVFSRKGFHSATIREIAELADVAEGTIYTYFADKRDLLLAIMRHLIINTTSDALAEFETEDDREFLRSVLDERFLLVDRNMTFMRALILEVWTDRAFRQQYLSQIVYPLLKVMEGYLQDRIEAGHFRPVKTRIIVRAILGTILSFLLLSEPEQGGLEVGVPREELVDELVDFYLVGLQVRPSPASEGESQG